MTGGVSTDRRLLDRSGQGERKYPSGTRKKANRGGEGNGVRTERVRRGCGEGEGEVVGRDGCSRSRVTEIRYNFPRQLRSLRIATN